MRPARFAHEDPHGLTAPGDLDGARAWLAEIAAVPDSRAYYLEIGIKAPKRRCERCMGAPLYQDPGACCSACRGFGFVRMTLDEIRDAYRELRDGSGTASDAFDQLVRYELGDVVDETPGHWLDAARRVASRMKEKHPRGLRIKKKGR